MAYIPRAIQATILRLSSLLNSGLEIGEGCIACLCEQPFPLAPNVDAVPFGAI